MHQRMEETMKHRVELQRMGKKEPKRHARKDFVYTMSAKSMYMWHVMSPRERGRAMIFAMRQKRRVTDTPISEDTYTPTPDKEAARVSFPKNTRAMWRKMSAISRIKCIDAACAITRIVMSL